MLIKVTLLSISYRCPSYQNLASTCVMITDTNDPCCMVPKCGFDVATGQIPVPVPSYNQATSYVGIVKPPVPTLYPTVYPDGPWVILNTTGMQPVAPTAPTNVRQGKINLHVKKEFEVIMEIHILNSCSSLSVMKSLKFVNDNLGYCLASFTVPILDPQSF